MNTFALLLALMALILQALATLCNATSLSTTATVTVINPTLPLVTVFCLGTQCATVSMPPMVSTSLSGLPDASTTVNHNLTSPAVFSTCLPPLNLTNPLVSAGAAAATFGNINACRNEIVNLSTTNTFTILAPSMNSTASTLINTTTALVNTSTVPSTTSNPFSAPKIDSIAGTSTQIVTVSVGSTTSTTLGVGSTITSLTSNNGGSGGTFATSTSSNSSAANPTSAAHPGPQPARIFLWLAYLFANVSPQSATTTTEHMTTDIATTTVKTTVPKGLSMSPTEVAPGVSVATTYLSTTVITASPTFIATASTNHTNHTAFTSTSPDLVVALMVSVSYISGLALGALFLLVI